MSKKFVQVPGRPFGQPLEGTEPGHVYSRQAEAQSRAAVRNSVYAARHKARKAAWELKNIVADEQYRRVRFSR